eukprot:3950130-Heterocapsa_arctica.AAC.1
MVPSGTYPSLKLPFRPEPTFCTYRTCLVQNPDIKGSTSESQQTRRRLRPRAPTTGVATFNII